MCKVEPAVQQTRGGGNMSETSLVRSTGPGAGRPRDVGAVWMH